MNDKRAVHFNSKLWIGISLVFLFVATLFCFGLLESDAYPLSISGLAFGDGMVWATSARVKFLNGVWARPGIDEPVFSMIPLHSLAVYLGFLLNGLTLIGLRLVSFVGILATKFIIAYWVYRYAGKAYAVLAIVFLALFYPLNEMSRACNPEAIQIFLFSASVFLLLMGEEKQKLGYYALAAILMAICHVYKTSIFLLPAFPLIYWVMYAKFNGEKLKLPGWNSVPTIFYAVLVGAGIIYIVTWMLPHWSDFYGLFLRGNYSGETGTSNNLIRHLLDPFMASCISEWSYNYISGNLIWMVSIPALAALLCAMEPSRRSRLDTVFLAYSLMMLVQISISDFSWRRFFTIIPLGHWAVFRLIYLVLNWRDFPLRQQIGWKAWLIMGYCVYVISVTIAAVLGAKSDYPLYYAGLAAAPLIIIAIYMMTKRWPKTMASSLLAGLIMTSSWGWGLSYNYFFNDTYYVKESSLALRQLDTARTYGLYTFGLYNQTNSYYSNTWTTLLRPTDMVWASSQGLTVRELAEKYRFRSQRALLIWLTGYFSPEFYDRWVLPPDYANKYQSDVFLTPPPSAVTVSSRYLLMRAKEKEVYITPSWAHFLTKYSDQKPVLGPPVLKVTSPPETWGGKPHISTVSRIESWVEKSSKDNSANGG